MKLSTRSRYGTRMMLDLAQHYGEGPVRIGDIAKRQDISVKYLEQLIIPLKGAKFIKSVRGPKGGHMIAKPPHEISIGAIVKVLEGELAILHCINDPDVCQRGSYCPIRGVWESASLAMVEKLDSITLSDMLKQP